MGGTKKTVPPFHGGTKKTVPAFHGGFSFIFFRDNVTVNVTDHVTVNGTETKVTSHQIVLELLKENPMRSREEMAGIIGKTVRTVQRALDKLSAEGKIKRRSISFARISGEQE